MTTSAQPLGPLGFTIVTSRVPDRLTKTLSLGQDGALVKSSAGSIVDGHAQHAFATDLRDLDEQLNALAPNQAVTWGLSSRSDVAIVTRKAHEANPNAIPRDREHFAFAAGPGVMMLDHDEAGPSGETLARDSLWSALIAACPALSEAPMLIRPSSGCSVLGAQRQVLSPPKWRVYIPVTNAVDIPAAGKRLLALLHRLGQVWVRPSTAGSILVRTVIDGSVWTPEHLDFAANPELRDGLTREHSTGQVYGISSGLFDLARIQPSVEDERAAKDARRRAIDKAAPALAVARENYLTREVPALARRLGCGLEDARARLAKPVGRNELPSGFPLRMNDGRMVCVGDLLSDRDRFHKSQMADPLEPDYEDDSRIAIAFLSGQEQPTIFSHAHGGTTYLLDPARLAFGVVAPPLPPGASHTPIPRASCASNATPLPLVTSPGRMVLHADAPLATARSLIETKYAQAGLPCLRFWQSAFYSWQGAAWREMSNDDLRAEIYAFIEACVIEFKPNQTKVSNIFDALKAAAILPSTTRVPSWTNGATGQNPTELVACANGILHLPTQRLDPPSPAYFNLNAVPVRFDPTAPKPKEWLRFLGQVWPDDQEAISTLQEIFGYMLTPDTSQQKLFLLVGPKRSGKGTIGRVVTELLGPDNVAGPTLGSLAKQFGLQGLVGKLAAVVSDARLSGRTDQKDVAENLLRISGEDPIDVDRKFLSPMTLRLWARFLLMTNELPRIADASGAMASRFVIVTMRQSFFGREDPGLTKRLLAELPGIFLWAIEGWQRLNARGHFVEPASSAEAARELADLGSPVGAFLREACTVAPGQEVEVDRLFETWRGWCREQGIEHHGTKATFGRDLGAAVPELQRGQRRGGDDRSRVYRGVGLRIGTPWHAFQGIAGNFGK